MSSGVSYASEPQVLRPYHAAEALTAAEAASIYRKSERTIRDWSQLHDLGRKIGGRWMVSKVALAMWFDGNTVALSAYLRGDRTAPIIVEYFERCGVPLVGRRAA
jgi:hypothetical protein